MKLGSFILVILGSIAYSGMAQATAFGKAECEHAAVSESLILDMGYDDARKILISNGWTPTTHRLKGPSDTPTENPDLFCTASFCLATFGDEYRATLDLYIPDGIGGITIICPGKSYKIFGGSE